MTQQGTRDPAPAGMRYQVSQAATSAWRESVFALYLGRARRTGIRFEVPTLRRDGTPKGERPMRRFLTKLPSRIVGFLVGITLGPLVLIWIVVQGGLDNLYELFTADTRNAPLIGLPPDIGRTITVTAAAPSVAAVAVAWALTRRRGHLWLVLSAHSVALIQVMDGRQEVLSTMTGRERPVLATQQVTLRWADASTMTFDLPSREKRSFKAQMKGRASI